MPRHSLVRRSAAALFMMTMVLANGWIDPRLGLGQERLRAGQDLLRTLPYDRVTLTDGTTLDVEPISPRPLPEYDADLARRIEEREKSVPREGNILLPDQKAALSTAKSRADDAQRAAEQAGELSLKPVGDPNVYKVRRTSIKSVRYFEDLLLEEGDRLVNQRNFAKAFEHYLLVANRAGDWPGLQDRVDRLLYEEGSAAISEGDSERGLRLLRELFARKPRYPGLLDQLAKSYGGRIQRAFELGAYPEGRLILHELAQIAPGHPVTSASQAMFVERATALMKKSAVSETGADQLDAVTDALRVWPSLEGAEAAYRAAFATLPTLDVAVLDIPRPLGPWIRSPADARVSPLIYLPLLAGEGEEARQGSLRNQLASRLEVSDLGRRFEMTLRDSSVWSDGSGLVNAIDVVRALADQADPLSPRYNARWDRLLSRAEVVGTSQVLVSLRRSLLTPEIWLQGPIGPAHAARDGLVSAPDGSRHYVVSGPYHPEVSTSSPVSYVATGSGSAAIRRIREFTVPDEARLITALERGEVSLVERLPPNRVAELTRRDGIRVGRYVRPKLHLLAIDGRNEVLTNRLLRRAISYAIDRETILREHLLDRPPDAENRPLDGVFAADSYANAEGVKPLEHNALLAKMLVAAARKELSSGPIRLRFEYPSSPEVRRAVVPMIAAWNAAGLQIEPVEQLESTLESELRMGRRFDLAYRMLDCPDPVADAGPLLCPGYDAPGSTDALASVASPRILQMLLELEYAPEFATARGMVIQIDREVRDELPVIPLWQLVAHYAWRERLSGLSETCDSLYDHIERWEVEPWFARDPW